MATRDQTLAELKRNYEEAEAEVKKWREKYAENNSLYNEKKYAFANKKLDIIKTTYEFKLAESGNASEEDIAIGQAILESGAISGSGTMTVDATITVNSSTDNDDATIVSDALSENREAINNDDTVVDETDETGSTVGEITGETLSNLAKKQDDSSDDETTIPNGKNKPITEAEVKKIFKDEFERYYRRSYPTFEVTGGGPTDRHEQSEYCVTTQSAQGIHFYEGGIAKIKANKNFELYSGYDASIGDGEVTGEGGNAFKIECKHGRILITSKASDIELNGRNIMIKAQKNIYLEAEINTRIRSGNDTNILTGNDMNIVADKELFVGGGGAVEYIVKVIS